MCLAQGHNLVTQVRLKPATPRSRVKHSTTESLRSHAAAHSNVVILLLLVNCFYHMTSQLGMI